ncbi:MAG: DAK2 domain-containing protein, partial [Dehalococcoidales bacterium]|nr:DAK2 domain-containing protein [Dehalococcoidales bacterium]
MKQVNSLGGQDLREMFVAAAGWLEKSSSEIDALNVFPVPDGDTGTNMLLTMRSLVEEAYRAPDHSAAAVAQAMAKGALLGARGNSGVILSQILRGLAQGLTEKETFTAVELASALQQSAATAYSGLSNPVEGTILTVIKDVAAAVQAQVSGGGDDLVLLMEAAVDAAGESVGNTPNLLQVLREAGVVDAGGQGLYTILEGALRYLRGEVEQMRFRKPQIIVGNVHATKLPEMIAADEDPYGYCTEFLLKGEKIDTDRIKKKLEKKGESLIVVGDEAAVRIHVHTLDPGEVLTYAADRGTMHQVSIRNMDEQHQDYLEMQKEKTPAVNIGIIAVVVGEGLTEVFTSLGASAVVPGGQTMNPSTKDLLQAVERVVSDKIIMLPNNKNIMATANQVQSLTEKTIAVVPTITIPQGVAALLAFDYEVNLETNTQLMQKAASVVKSIEITRAARATQLGGLEIKKKQHIGFLDGDLVAVADSTDDVLDQVLVRLDLGKAEVVTIYGGADIEADEVEQMGSGLREKYPQLQIEVIQGGQPH